MQAHLEEVFLQTFRADPDSFRHLDAILRRRCQEIHPAIGVEYEFRRTDGWQQRTNDIEEFLKEGNGDTTAITSLVARARMPNTLDLAVSFRDVASIAIRGNEPDKIVLTASDIRSHVQGRMKGPAAHLRGIPYWGIASFVALAAFSAA